MSTMSTESIIKTDEPVTSHLPELDDDVSDFDGFAHYTRVKGLLEGGVQVALCGKKWIPKTIGNAGDFPVHPLCKELYELLKAMDS